jgi:hypothetical protein
MTCVIPFSWTAAFCATLRLEFYETVSQIKGFNPNILCADGFNKKTMKTLVDIAGMYMKDDRIKNESGEPLPFYEALSLAGWMLTGMGVIDHLVVKNGHTFHGIKCVDTVLSYKDAPFTSSVTFPNWNGIKAQLTPEELESPVLAKKDLKAVFKRVA